MNEAEIEIVDAVATAEAAYPEWLVEAAKAYRRHERAPSAVLDYADDRYVNACCSGCVVVHTEASPADCNTAWAQAEEAATKRAFQLHALAEAFKAAREMR